MTKRGENVHEGHRARLRRRFTEEGLDGFEDHQVLELVLFYAIPRRDTNEIAHLLLRRFGSLSGVLEADPADLSHVEGVGDGAAALLSLLPALTRRYYIDRVHQVRHALTSSERAAAFLIPFMAGRTQEVFYVVCLDTQSRVIVPALVAEGLPDRVHVEPRQVVEAALRHKAFAVILAHNHPTGQAKPSTADHRVTQRLCDAFSAIGVGVRDHIIIAGDDWFSFALSGDLPAPSSPQR
jgi:DNA repair protein RadC